MNLQVVIDSLTKILTDILDFIPRFINGLIILLVGYLVARVLRWLVGTVLRRVQFDDLVERAGITGTLRGLGVRTPLSTISAQTVYVLLLLSFLITASRLMGLDAVAHLLEALLNYLPSVLAAGIVFVLGGIVAQWFGGLVGTVATGAGIAYGSRLGTVVHNVVSVFVVVIALGVLGVDTNILVTTLTILIAAFGLGIGLALGLGARPIVFHLLAGYYIRQRFPTGSRLTLDQVAGAVQSVGTVNTVVTNPAGATVIPNGVLLERVVQAPAPPPPEAPPA
jgi:small-conductance mechanosensitive channel